MTLLLLSGIGSYGNNRMSSEENDTGSIRVKLTGIKSSKGQVGILVFTKKDGFPSDWEKAYMQILIPANGGEMEHTFTGLPFGNYAVSVMHDENQNNKLDTNMLGMPKEGYGVSNNVVGNLSAPKYEDAAFTLQQEQYLTEIKLKY